MTEPEYKRASVVDLAGRARAWAEQQRSDDPYAKPYSPSEDEAIQLCRKMGPTAAFYVITERWDASKRMMAGQRLQDAQRQQREFERARDRRREVTDGRADLHPWERIARAHKLALTCSEGATAKLDGDMVSGGVEHPSRVLSAAERSVPDVVYDLALATARRVERLVERRLYRSFPEDNTDPMDDRIVRHAGRTPEEIYRDFPDLNPKLVRARRVALGVDPETGVREAA